MTLDIKQIQEIIPHRYPFLFLDKVEELVPGESIVAYKNVSVNEPFFQGHFPDEPVMPGVLQVEAVAQAGAVIMLTLEKFKGQIAYFASIKEARFKRKVVPGDVLKIECKITDQRGPMGRGKGTITCGGELVMNCELLFAIGV